jgi:hypothetical protein
LRRPTSTIGLVEDGAQRDFLRAFLKLCWGAEYVPSKIRWLPLGGEAHVRKNFASEVRVLRQALHRMTCLLIVMLDADASSIEERRRQLEGTLKDEGLDTSKFLDKIVILIPRRHIETWICVLSGTSVDEEMDCKKVIGEPSPDLVERAALRMYEVTRPGRSPSTMPLPSLLASIPEWRKIPCGRAARR